MVYTHKHAETSYYQSAALHTRRLFSCQRQLCYSVTDRSYKGRHCGPTSVHLHSATRRLHSTYGNRVIWRSDAIQTSNPIFVTNVIRGANF